MDDERHTLIAIGIGILLTAATVALAWALAEIIR